MALVLSWKRLKMNRNYSLSKGVSLLVIGLAFSITAIYSVFVIGYAWVIEDNILNRLVAAEAANIKSEYANTGTIPAIRSDFMTLHKNWQGIAKDIRDAHKLSPDQIEFVTPKNTTVHLNIFQLNNEEYVILANVEDYEVSRDFFSTLIGWLIFSAIICCAVVSFIAYKLVKRMLLPMQQLTHEVNFLEESTMANDFAERFSGEEVQVLAGAIQNSFTRLQETLKREINFTRDVSHELRTPISVIKNILSKNNQSISVTEGEFLQLAKSSHELEQVTNTLLALAREESRQLSDVNLTDLLEQSLLSHFSLNHSVKGKQLVLDVKLAEAVYCHVNQNLTQILINNVLSNIVQYATGHEVQIILTDSQLSFSNISSVAIPNTPEKAGVKSGSSTGIGQGLNLIKRICETNQWRLQTNYHSSQFTVSINFE